MLSFLPAPSWLLLPRYAAPVSGEEVYRKYCDGVQANGGSLDGAGPVISGGMVFVNSGYPRFGGMPGNVLLAFGPED